MVDNSLPVTLSTLVASAVFTSDVFAFKSNAACAADDTGLFASLVLSAFPNPTIVFVTPLTVPVKVGEARFAFSARLAVTSDEFAFDANAGTVGNVAVPPKSPANFILPIVFASASGVAPLTVAST